MKPSCATLLKAPVVAIAEIRELHYLFLKVRLSLISWVGQMGPGKAIWE